MKKSEIYKIRYQIYRDLGYTPAESRTLRSRPLFSVQEKEPETKKQKTKKYEVESIDFAKALIKFGKDGHVIKNKAYRAIRDSMTGPKDVNKFVNKARTVPNDSVYSRWGMLTQDERYRDQTNKLANFIQKDLKLTDKDGKTKGLDNDQVYYFLYYMTRNKLTYKQSKDELLTSADFEKYKPKGKRI